MLSTMTFKGLARPLFGGLLGLVVSLSTVSTTQAALIVTNGGFSNPYGSSVSHGIGDFWKYAQDWHVTNTSSTKNFTFAKDNIFLPANEYYLYVDRPGDSIYQSLGTRDAGDAGIQFKFDAFERGEPSGEGEAFEQVTLEIYYDNSGGSFTPANGTEVNTLALLDSQTILGSSLGFDGLAGGGSESAFDVMTSVLDLTGAPIGSEIYLRIGQDGNNGEPYLDNLSSHVIEAVPEPSTYVMAVLGLSGMTLLVRRKRCGTRAPRTAGRALVLLVAAIALSSSAGTASAAFMFAEDFNSATPNPNLEGYSRFTVGGGVIRRNGNHSNHNDRRYLRTTGTNYNEADFRFELTFTTTLFPEVSINYIGLGRADRGPSGASNPYNKPYDSLFFRIHGPGTVGGGVTVANSLAHGSNIANLGAITTPGTHRALIEKVGNEITFAIDAHYNGTFASDLSHTFTDFAAITPFLDNTNSRLFFGTAQDYDSFDDWNLESIVPEPSTYVMAVLGLVGLGFYGVRRRKGSLRRQA